MTTTPGDSPRVPRAVSDDELRVPRRAFAEYPGDPAHSGARRYMLRLTPNGAEPLADSVASLDRLLLVFTIGADAGPEITPERISAHVTDSLNLSGRVHVLLEPMSIDDEGSDG